MITNTLKSSCEPTIIEMIEVANEITGSYDSYGVEVVKSFVNTSNLSVVSASFTNSKNTENNILGSPNGTSQDANTYVNAVLYTIVKVSPFTPPLNSIIQNFKVGFTANSYNSNAELNDAINFSGILKNMNSIDLSNIYNNGTMLTGNLVNDIPNFLNNYHYNTSEFKHTDTLGVTTTNVTNTYKNSNGWKNIHNLPFGSYGYETVVTGVDYEMILSGIALLMSVDDDSPVGTSPSIGLDSVRVQYDYVRNASATKFIRKINCDGSFTDINIDGTPYVQAVDSVIMSTEEYLASEFCKCSNSSSTISYTTGFSSELLNNALTIPTAPANTKEVVIMNNTNALLSFDTNKGIIQVFPFGSISFSVFDYETGIIFVNMTVESGTFNSGEQVLLNYKTSVSI